MIRSNALLSAGLVLGFAATMPTASADAQRIREAQRQGQGQQQQQQQGQAQIQGLSRSENAAVMPVYQAVQQRDWAAATAALPAAQAAANSGRARYVVAQLQLEIARGTNNVPLATQAIDAMLASGAAPPEQVEQLRAARAQINAPADPAALEAQLAQQLTASPNNIDLMMRLAAVRAQLNRRDEALALYQRAIAASRTAGQPVAEDVIKRALAIAYQARQTQPSLELARELVAAYPNAQNWRDALTIYREFGAGTDQELAFDIGRLMRAARAMTSEADFVTHAQAAQRAAAFGEVKGVLEEAFARNVIQPSNTAAVRQMLTSANGRIAEDRRSLAGERTAALGSGDVRRIIRIGDSYYGYGQYADAAAVYRAALERGSGDANVINTRLGAALAMAGQRAEAQTAFRAVTGPRAGLAAYWLLWLERGAQPGAQPAQPAQQ